MEGLAREPGLGSISRRRGSTMPDGRALRTLSRSSVVRSLGSARSR